MKFSSVRGFTLIELMVVLTILAIIAVISISVYSGVNARARDAVRLSDFAKIRQAITLATHDASNLSFLLCVQTETPCTGSSFPKTSASENTDGTGWIKIDFDNRNYVNFIHLPSDPLNNAKYNYTYYSNGTEWKIETVLESKESLKYMINDHGTNPEKYELFSKNYTPES